MPVYVMHLRLFVNILNLVAAALVLFCFSCLCRKSQTLPVVVQPTEEYTNINQNTTLLISALFCEETISTLLDIYVLKITNQT